MDRFDPEELMQKDEMLKAVELAKSLPENDPRRKTIEQHAGHLASSQAYQTYYQTMRGGICPEDQVFRRHEQIKRFALIRKLILERKHKTVLDLGCLDGWQLLNLASSGVSGVGVDLSPQALAVAFERSAKWGFGLRFIESSIEDFDILGNSPCPIDGFDAVILSEVLEHVLDPLACLKTAARHLAKGGVVYVSVPASPVPHHGKLEDAREHLRVFSEEDLKSLAAQAGLSAVVDQDVIQEYDEGQAYTHRMMSFRRMTVTVFCNHVTGGWDPAKKDDLGASEEMVVKVAEAWVRQGCDVLIHQNGASQRTVNGVAYRERSVPPDVRDLLVLFKTTDHSNIKAGAKIFWTTDLPAPGMAASFLPPRVVDNLDAVVCISEYHRQELLKACPWLPPDKVKQHWLGIDEAEIDSTKTHAKVPGRVLYASSYDRGLGALLEMWPKVRKQVPSAELHVTYGWDFWKRSEAVVSESVAESMRQERARLEKLLLQPGVVDCGRLARADFLRELGEAAVWAYPCTGGELCCKTALEAQAAGCRPVVVPTMALAETVQWGSKTTPQMFSNALVHALQETRKVPISIGIPTWDVLATFLEKLAKPLPLDSSIGVQSPVGTALIDQPSIPPLPERFAIPTCIAQPPAIQGGLSILMAVQGMPFDGGTDREKSLGGSETAAIQLSRELVKRGHSVTVFSNLPGQPGKFDGVNYLPIQSFSQYACVTPHDVAIVQRDPTGLNQTVRSKLNVLWCHDLGLRRYHQPFRSSLWNVDYVTPVSHWHGRQLCEVYGLTPEIVAPMRNGIDLEAIRRSTDGRGVRDPNALVFASRPERGLDLLLSSVFPRLLERNPNLVLYIAGYDNTVTEMRGFYDHCQQLIANLGKRAKWLGHLKKAELYALYSRARAMLYVTRNFKEVSCITAMEAAACGLPLVATTLGALPETTSLIPGASELVPHPGQEATEDFIARYVEAAWQVINDDSLNKQMADAGRTGCETFSWVNVAREWEEFLYGGIEARSQDSLRLARHWWRLGDIPGVEQVLPELSPQQTAAFPQRYQLAEMEPDIAPQPDQHLINAVCQAAADVQPRTILGLGSYGPPAANAIATMLGISAVDVGPADFVFGIETLDCAVNPSAHLREASAQVVNGGHLCFVTACQGVQQDRLHRGEPRRRRWTFDAHDIKELLGQVQDLLAAVIGNGTNSAYDGTPLSWSLFRFRAGAAPGELNLARRRWLQSPGLSLSGCLIVKNGESLLGRCLKSIAPYCDEIVVDDNGSTDTTPDILRRFGICATKGLNPIDMGFDAARNQNVSRATGDFILWIDADEELLDAHQLPKYLRWSVYDGFGVAQHHFSAVPPNAFKPDLPVRLYRRQRLNGKESGIRFYGCLAGDTPIATPQGPKSIESLVGMKPWVYCYDHTRGQISLAQADWVGMTKERAKLLEIELDDGTKIQSTEEHPFLLRKAWKDVVPGSYVAAKDLKPGDRLMPFYRWQDGRNAGTDRGWMIALRGIKFQTDEHRFVYEHLVGKIPPGFVVHQKDYNPANNDPSNLETMSKSAHTQLHHKGAKRSEEIRQRISDNHASCSGEDNSMWGHVHSKEARQKIGEKSCERGAGYGNSEQSWFTPKRVVDLNRQTWADPEIRARRIAGIRAAKAAARRDIGLPKNNHRVVAIRDGGFEAVYNIQMPGPHHNFVAGGVVVHNCVHEHPEIALNSSVGQSIVLSDVHIAHDGYLTETGRRKRFERNIALMFRDRIAYPERILGKFLMIRDWVHLARYQLERNRTLTADAVQFLESAIESYRKDFLGHSHVMAVDGLAYYNEALQHLGRGFEVQIVLKVGGLDGQPHELTYAGRVASPEDLATLLNGGVHDLTSIWQGEYL